MNLTRFSGVMLSKNGDSYFVGVTRPTGGGTGFLLVVGLHSDFHEVVGFTEIRVNDGVKFINRILSGFCRD